MWFLLSYMDASDAAVTRDITYLDCYRQMPFMRLPIRSTLVRLGGRGVLISPGSRLTPQQLSSVPGVTDIVASSLIHCAGVPQAASIHTTAVLWGAPGARVAKPKISWHHELTVESWPYSQDLPMLALAGMPKLGEVVFFHKASRTLIVTDLCFNLDEQGLGPRIILSLFGTYRRFACSRLFLKYVTDKAAFTRSLSSMMEWDFDSIVMSHGGNLRGNAKHRLRLALAERGIVL